MPFFGEEAQWNEQALVHKMHRCERYGACADELPGPAKIVHRTIFARASSPTIYNPTKKRPFGLSSVGAGNGARTRHLSLGKAALYQMSYSRKLVPPQGFFASPPAALSHRSQLRAACAIRPWQTVHWTVCQRASNPSIGIQFQSTGSAGVLELVPPQGFEPWTP